MGERHRVRLGDRVQLVQEGTNAATLFARVLVEFDNGALRMVPLTLVSGVVRAIQAQEVGPVEANGRVVRAIVTGAGLAKRGQNFVELVILNSDREVQDILTADYVHNGHAALLDQIVDPGPGGGNGHILKNVLADDVTPVDIEHTLGITNALRRIDGFIWYYHRDGTVDDVTMRVSARDFGVGLPTGMTSGGNTLQQVWPSAGVVTLSANQEGFIYVSAQNGSRIAVSGDNGARTIEDSSVAQPLPFPYWADETDVGELFFDVGNAQAADRHSIYIIEEQWIDV